MAMVIFASIADIVATVHAVLLARQQGRGLWAYIVSGSRCVMGVPVWAGGY